LILGRFAFETGRKMFEKIKEINSDFAKSDASGEIIVLGKLEDNNLKPPYSGDTMPKYKLTILEIKNYQPNQDSMVSFCLKDYGTKIIEMR
jgi:hypothetical protein